MRIFISILVLLISFTTYSFSQEVVLDRIESDGSRQLMTKTQKFNFGGNKYSIGIKAYVYENHTDLLLMISSYHHISDSSIVLLKLRNEEIIELPVNNVNVGTVTKPGVGVTGVGAFGVAVTKYTPSSDYNYYSSVYVLTDELISKIKSEGIKKMRIFDGLEGHDKKHCGVISRYVVDGIDLIKVKMKKDKRKRNLYEDF